MKLLNLGCGNTFSKEREWTNIDFIANGKEIVSYNLLKGIPFEDNSFDLVYHSHVLEHFSKVDGERFISECFRVVKPGGVIRIAVPNLEKIAENYLQLLNGCLENPDNDLTRHNYEWILLEMFDQTVRNASGGEMGKYLCQAELINEQFVLDRIGEEGKKIRKHYLITQHELRMTNAAKGAKMTSSRKSLKNFIKKWLFSRLKIDEQALAIGNFRLGGEIHQWMYDRFSLSDLLLRKGFIDVVVRDAFTSYCTVWQQYNLDGKDGIVRKPDSLFIEAKKS